MLTFEINQQLGRRISVKLWRQWLQRIETVIKIKKNSLLSIALVGQTESRKLNLKYRGKDKATNVLSFAERDIKQPKVPSLVASYLGEIVICYPVAQLTAKQSGVAVTEEIKRLFVHGVLHLLGYDHQRAGESKKMEALEQKILAD